jgi:hypothetical protein
MRSFLALAVLTAAGNSAFSQTLDSVRPGGFVLAPIRMYDSAPISVDPASHDGFELKMARITLDAMGTVGRLTLYSHVEADLTPQFQMQDYYLTGSLVLPRDGALAVTTGQFKVPFSRQVLVRDTDIQMINKAALTTLAPGRQLGLATRLNVPVVPMVEISAGIFNGKGINVIDNIDDNFMAVGRIALRPLGPYAPLIESAIGPDQLSVAFSASRNVLRLGTYDETTVLLGVDAFASWRGLSAYVEYLNGDVSYPAGAPQVPYGKAGVNFQGGYLLPIPGYLYRRFEVAFRYEEIDRNDTLPIERPGDPNQSLRTIVGGLHYYQNGHNLKLQLEYFHTTQIEDRDRLGQPATFPDDALLVQLTYRLE